MFNKNIFIKQVVNESKINVICKYFINNILKVYLN